MELRGWDNNPDLRQSREKRNNTFINIFPIYIELVIKAVPFTEFKVSLCFPFDTYCKMTLSKETPIVFKMPAEDKQHLECTLYHNDMPLIN